MQAVARGRRVRRWVKGQLEQRGDGKLARKPTRGLLRSASALIEKHLGRPSKSHPGRQSHRESKSDGKPAGSKVGKQQKGAVEKKGKEKKQKEPKGKQVKL